MSEQQWPNSKELYMMNGGNKLYIYKDGFGDIYNATPEEEAQWAKEVIAHELNKIDQEENATGLTFAIENLQFHKYPGLETLLIEKLKDAGTKRQIVFATSLWKLFKYGKSLEIIRQHFITHQQEVIDDVFWGLIAFKDHPGAAGFLVDCLESNNDQLNKKAHTTISMWAYTGLPTLRENNLLERLDPANRHNASFKTAVAAFKKITQN